jgi:hypothetical protein
MRLATSPSKSSTAVPRRVIAVPAGTVVPETGLTTVTRGGVLGARATIGTLALLLRPLPSVAVAVITCAPTLSTATLKRPPVPSRPSRSEDQTTLAPMS